MASRRKAREFALQMLYQHDLTETAPEEVTRLFWGSRETDTETRDFAEQLFRGSVERAAEIDALIGKHSRHWQLPRMAAVDRNVLRLAIWELLHHEAPAAVVIDEAIEVARKFSGSESSVFVNGILDSVRKELDLEDGNEERANERRGDGPDTTALS